MGIIKEVGYEEIMSKHFDYKIYATCMREQAKAVLPCDISKDEQKYILDIVEDFSIVAGEALNDEESFSLSLEQKQMFVQIIVEWTFHKLLDCIRSEIPKRYTDDLVRKIAFEIFEIEKFSIGKEMEQDDLLNLIKSKVETTYKQALDEFYDKKILDKQIYERALKQSNYNLLQNKELLESTYNKEDAERVEKKSKDNEVDEVKLFLILMSVLVPIIVGLIWYFKDFILLYKVPISIFIVVIVCIFIVFFFLVKRDVKEQLNKLEKVRQDMQDLINPNRMYSRLGVDDLKLLVGKDLVPIADPDEDGEILPKIAALRQSLTDELGYIIPNIRILDDSEIGTNEYVIFIRNNNVFRGFVYPSKRMINVECWDYTGFDLPEDFVEDVNPIDGKPCYWVKEDSCGDILKSFTYSAEDVIIEHIKKSLIENVDDVLLTSQLYKYLEFAKSIDDEEFNIKDTTNVVESLQKRLPVEELRCIFSNLIRENISIKDIKYILDKLNIYSKYSAEADELSEKLRFDMRTYITNLHKDVDNTMKVFEFDDISENMLEKYKVKNFGKIQLNLAEDLNTKLISKITELISKWDKREGFNPVILTTSSLRLALYRTISREIPSVIVMSRDEVLKSVKIDVLEIVRL